MDKEIKSVGNTKSKLPLIIIIFSILLLGSAGTLTYFYIRETNRNKTIQVDYATLQTQYTEKETEITQLEEQVETYGQKITKIDAYNDVDKYIYDTILKHAGFTGWTQTEYNTVKAMADKIGDKELSASLHSAWYDRNGLPVARFTRLMLAIIDGIGDNTK
jgi:lipopolysaccharide/colanic/teichoic acid biosynthesis glycosyltransferase